jgi:hypothetical protein
MDPAESRRPEVGDPLAAQPPPTQWDEHPSAVSRRRDLLPGDQPQARPRGRHEAPRGHGPPGGIATMAAVVAVVMIAGVAATRLMSSAEPAPAQPAASTVATAAGEAGPTTRPPGSRASGNLVDNWSFEQDLGGWQVVGAVEAGREPQGRTSGSCALVRARGPQPGRVGLRLPAAVTDAPTGSRYVAKAWVRSTAPGLGVTVRLVGAGAKPEASQATAATLPGLAWRAVMVDHTVAAASELAVEITADGVAPGDALLVDEVIVRQG